MTDNAPHDSAVARIGQIDVLPGSGIAAAVAVPTPPVSPNPQRAELLDRVAQDRAELIQVVGSMRAPLHALETAQKVLVLTGRSIRWIALAGNLAAIVMSLRRNSRRPPLMLLFGVSLQLITLWSNRTVQGPVRVQGRPAPVPVTRAKARSR